MSVKMFRIRKTPASTIPLNSLFNPIATWQKFKNFKSTLLLQLAVFPLSFIRIRIQPKIRIRNQVSVVSFYPIISYLCISENKIKISPTKLVCREKISSFSKARHFKLQSKGTKQKIGAQVMMSYEYEYFLANICCTRNSRARVNNNSNILLYY